MSISPFNRKPVRLLIPTGFPDAKADFAVESLRALTAPAHVALPVEIVRGDYADELVRLGRRHGRKGQLNCHTILDTIIERLVPEQKTDPRYDVILLDQDIYGEDTNFVYGVGTHLVGCVFSFKRFDDQEAARTVLMHELGHTFGLPLRKERVEESLGTHCVNDGCLMRQFMCMDEVMEKTRDRLAADQPLCGLCREDLIRHFWVSRPDAPQDETPRRKRMNSDVAIRDAERTWRKTGATEDCLRWGVARARRGEFPMEYVVGERPWEHGLTDEYRGSVGTRQRIWEASVCSGEPLRRTAFFCYDGMSFRGQLEAIASPSAYPLAFRAISERESDPNGIEFMFVSHPEDQAPSFRIMLRSGRLLGSVFRPTESDIEAMRREALDSTTRMLWSEASVPPDSWWRHWNPANYPSMEMLASEISSRLG